MRPKLDKDDNTLAHNDAGLTLSGSAGSGVLTKPKGMTSDQEDKWMRSVASRGNDLDTKTYMEILLDESIPKNKLKKIYNQRFGITPGTSWYRRVV